MAIKLSDEYTNVNAPDLDYPQGSIKNSTTPTATDGTPVDELWGNDQQGLLQAILLESGITPSGVPDTARESQYLKGLKSIMGLNSDSLRTVTATTTVLSTDVVIILDGSAAAVDLTLLSAADTSARTIRIHRLRSDPGSNTVRVLPDGAETIVGESSVSLIPGESIELVPDGATDYIQF